MSKEKPEVGDVWTDQECRKLFLFQVTDKYLHFMRRKNKYPDNTNSVVVFTFTRRWFLEVSRFDYLGKSKVSIKELFDAKEKNNE